MEDWSERSGVVELRRFEGAEVVRGGEERRNGLVRSGEPSVSLYLPNDSKSMILLGPLS